ncbi:MAG: Dabb family protein [Oscillospiraceae bacterium]|nr:Dabb family protein [Oscillospiraceae bacterium]
MVIRHISVFTFLDNPANGKTKAENIETVRAYLEQVPVLYPTMKNQVIGSTLGGTPVLPDDAPVMFGDLVQIADYDTVEDAAGYPPSKAHMDLVEFSTPMLKKVTAIDFEL